MTTTTRKFKVSVEVTAEEIDDIMVTALEGAITYWCDSAEVKGMDFCGGGYASDVISRGGALWLHYNDGDTDKRVLLTLPKFLTGLAAAMRTGFDFEDYDANDADRVIQWAVFGELVYG